MAKLYQLPNGDWIDLNTVTAVHVLPAHAGTFTNVRHPDRVTIHAGRANIHVLPSPGPDEARDLRDRIAAAVNGTV